jgi:hypothetical protein
LPDLQFYFELARKDEARMASVLDAITSSSEFQMGSYFGRWCTEAVGVVRAFNIDDSLCWALSITHEILSIAARAVQIPKEMQEKLVSEVFNS